MKEMKVTWRRELMLEGALTRGLGGTGEVGGEREEEDNARGEEGEGEGGLLVTLLSKLRELVAWLQVTLELLAARFPDTAIAMDVAIADEMAEEE